MNKINAVVLFIFLMLAGACYQKNSPTVSKAVQPAEKPSLTVEKNLEPSGEVKKSGDFNQALDYYNSKNYEKAIAEFGEVVKIEQKSQQAHFYLGKSHQALSKTDEAIGAYKKAIDIKPDYAEANYELGAIYLNRKDYETSLPYLKKAAKIKYTSAEYLVALGDNYRELNQCNYAMPPYGNSLGFNDKNPAAYYGMGLCYIVLKNRLAAAQQVSNLEKLDKNLAKKLSDQIPK